MVLISQNLKLMKPKKRHQALPCHVATALSLSLLTAAGYGEAVFAFDDNGPLDGAGVGATMTVLDADAAINVTLTTVEIVGQDGSLASEGAANTTNSTSSANALGGEFRGQFLRGRQR